MGCCLSTTTTKSSKPDNGGAPPPSPPLPSPPLEEETVKEVVLSEIPMLNATTLNAEETTQNAEEEDVKRIKPAKESTAMIKPAEDIISEVSEQSEMWSFSESLSTATAPEKREDDEEVTQRLSPVRKLRKRRNSGEITGARERVVRSQVTSSSRVGQAKHVATQKRNVGTANVHRRQSGECSSRRSRSPVTRGDVGKLQNVSQKSTGASETGRKVDRSPMKAVNRNSDRSPVKAVTRNSDRSPVKTVTQNGDRLPGKTVTKAGKEEKPDDVVLTAKNHDSESLENPVVSLECFIFL